jgi:hypothetical protein
MSDLLTQAIFAAEASSWEDAFWMQIMVFVLVAAGWGLYCLVKTKSNRFEEQEQNYSKPAHIQNIPAKVLQRPVSSPGKSPKDLHSGMELLESDFLLNVVENTQGSDHRDTTIRSLNFDELLRRGQLGRLDSNALRVYALNKGSFYDKHIQCAAIKELSNRTIVGYRLPMGETDKAGYRGRNVLDRQVSNLVQ